MMTQRHFAFKRGLVMTVQTIIIALLYSSSIVFAFFHLRWSWLAIPSLPVSILGTAVSFYLGFKGNAAYGRLWEARKIWGGIVNSSRTWATHVMTMTQESEAVSSEALFKARQTLIYRHIAWLGALRTQLRRRKSWEHGEDNDFYRERFGTLDNSPAKLESRIKPFISASELDWVMKRKNQSTQLLHLQSKQLKSLFEDGVLDDFRHMELANLIETFYTLQGKCERIKNFPLPRQYSTANRWFVRVFLMILPFSLIGAFNSADASFVWLTVPCTIILHWVFTTWDVVLDYSENPFEGLINDIPIDALSRTIEIDLREMLGEETLPEPLVAVDHVLM